ncbi:hypothetical protein JCM11251_002808 [Rhodosporidiobolus azoricus]
MATLKDLLASANALLGLATTPTAKLGQPKPSLSSVLAARLDAYRSLSANSGIHDETLTSDRSEKNLQRLTAAAALELLEQLADYTRSHAPPPPPSTSSSSTAHPSPVPPPPPMFGARDIKVIGMLAGIVGRWGIAEVAGLGGLAGEKGGRKLNEPKIQEVTAEDEEEEESANVGERKKRLSTLVHRVLSSVLGFSPSVPVSTPPSRTDSEKQFISLVLPQLLVPLVGGLVLLSQGGEGDEWAEQGLEKVFRSVPATTALSTLLALLASSPSSLPPDRSTLSLSRTHLSSLLSTQLLRPGGARSLLIVVVGVGSAAGGQEDEAGGDVVGERKMEMVRRLLSASPPVQGEMSEETAKEKTKAHFHNLTSQLLDILFTAASTSVTSTLASPSPASFAKGKAAAAAPKAPAVNVPLPILRAASYVLAHFLITSTPPASGTGTEDPISRCAKPFLLAALHTPLRPLSHSAIPPRLPASSTGDESDPGSLPLLNPIQLYTHLTALSLLLSSSPPLPTLLTTLLSPLLPCLFSLLSHLSAPPLIVSDPAIEGDKARRGTEDEAKALLGAFAKGEGEVEVVVRGLARAVEEWEKGEEFGRQDETHAEEDGERVVEWAWTDEGAPQLVLLSAPSASQHPLATDTSEENEPSLADLSLRVNPADLVSWLTTDVHPVRREIAAGLFLRWLDEVRVLQGTDGVEAAKRSITRLQLILGLVESLGGVSSDTAAGEGAAGEGISASTSRKNDSILTEPAQIVAFVAHALEGAAGDALAASQKEDAKEKGEGKRKGTRKKREKKQGLQGLRIVDDDIQAEGAERVKVEDDGDAEGDEGAGLGTGLGKDEMAMTALTLLLAVLEANPSLSTSNTPLLPVIASQLALLATHSPSAVIAPLAREAKMVLSLREAESALSSSSAANGHGEEKKDDPLAESRTTYRTALKLLQDPLLPVRAQGLTLLRSLVLDRKTALLSTDPALLPAVLDIFVSAIEEEDSFLYLNAVQGLGSLVDVYGAKVIGRLCDVYVGGGAGGGRMGEKVNVRDVGEGERGKRELDKRLRVGEALVQVVQRAGEALATLTSQLLPALLSTLLAPSLPIPLRSSALTILATCVETAPTAMLSHAETLAEVCVAVVEVETVALKPKLPPAKSKGMAENKVQEKTQDKGKGKRVLIEEVDSSSDGEDELLPPPKVLPNPLNRPRRPEELANPLTSSSKHPTLRRAALVFLAALVRTVAAQVAERREKEQAAAWRGNGAEGLLDGKLRMPGQGESDFLIREHRPRGEGMGMLIGIGVLLRARRVLGYVRETDEDALVRHQAGEVLEELEE